MMGSDPGGGIASRLELCMGGRVGIGRFGFDGTGISVGTDL